jgi:5'-methylthioadenosine phosphorylase
MTNMPEAKLAREAQMAYSTLAMVTDFDCWHPVEEHVTASLAMANLMQNASRAQYVLAEAIRLLGAEQPLSLAHSALQNALITRPDAMSPELRERLAALLVGFTT